MELTWNFQSKENQLLDYSVTFVMNLMLMKLRIVQDNVPEHKPHRYMSIPAVKNQLLKRNEKFQNLVNIAKAVKSLGMKLENVTMTKLFNVEMLPFFF